ncbi:unnamed protein product [Heterosigma akashiwo]|eukprot:CAMPEP_0194583128 /NCGR_PEP_ID=MMETSP0292-20121207/16112_1 /TAXON_ID=39354 /ORGANISM="Heterosigma akashiwo, Strain CCMP2393" /LENGTH=65 /DNA_ID=CAMNT_0039437605 /DNA_START=58 /DNA_END=255 /DNA_ORIENTATION=+
MTAATAFWRQAGLSYIQYLNVASSALRACLKEPAKTRALARGSVNYNWSAVQDGKLGSKVQQLGK